MHTSASAVGGIAGFYVCSSERAQGAVVTDRMQPRKKPIRRSPDRLPRVPRACTPARSVGLPPALRRCERCPVDAQGRPSPTRAFRYAACRSATARRFGLSVQGPSTVLQAGGPVLRMANSGSTGREPWPTGADWAASIASHRNCLARPMASSSGVPLASSAAIAAESVQPVP